MIVTYNGERERERERERDSYFLGDYKENESCKKQKTGKSKEKELYLWQLLRPIIQSPGHVIKEKESELARRWNRAKLGG